MNSIKKLAIYAGLFSALTIGCGKSSGGHPTPVPVPPPVVYQCNDSRDNDGDTLIDMADPGCSSATDNSETNSPPPTNQPPVINLKNVQYTQPETSQNIKYTANVTDVDNNLSSVVLELSTDGTNFTSYPMSSTGSNNYEKNITFNDGSVVRARIRAKDSQNLDSVSTFSNLSIYLSEADGQNEILSQISSMKTQPSIAVDQSATFFSTYPLDVLLTFSSANGILYNNTTSCNNARVPLAFISRTDELNSTQLNNLEAELTVYPYCGLNPPSMTRTPSAFISYDNLGVPTTKTDIAGIVDSLLTAEDLKINYKPVANIENIISVPKNTSFTINAQGSSDLDGTINLYELDLTSDGVYENSNTNGTFNILGGYPFDTCLTSTVRVTDDEGANSNSTIKIPVGSGVCF